METRNDVRRKHLAEQGLKTPYDLALWARRRGLLSVYLQFFSSPNRSVPAYWQALRPGYETDPDDERNLGNKTFPADGTEERITSLQEALVWLSLTYGVEKWVSVSGFPNCLFPDDVALALKEVCPSVSITNTRGKLQLSRSL